MVKQDQNFDIDLQKMIDIFHNPIDRRKIEFDNEEAINRYNERIKGISAISEGRMRKLREELRRRVVGKLNILSSGITDGYTGGLILIQNMESGYLDVAEYDSRRIILRSIVNPVCGYYYKISRINNTPFFVIYKYKCKVTTGDVI